MSLIPSAYGRRSNVFDPSSHDIFDPFRHDLPLMSSSHHDSSQLVASRIDWRETPQAHVFTADVPGLKKEEVKVEVEEGNILQISGQRSQDLEEKTDTWHRMERSSGIFVRRFRLPENAKLDQVKAGLEHGVLTVTVPKVEAKKPALKAIQITG